MLQPLQQVPANRDIAVHKRLHCFAQQIIFFIGAIEVVNIPPVLTVYTFDTGHQQRD